MTTPATTAHEAQHAELGMQSASPVAHTSHPEAQWFPLAGLGLFVHWGIASVHGNLDLSWAMMANTPWDAASPSLNKLTPEKYWKLAEQFSPQAWDPERWIAAAADAGFQYAVLTTMHHDGFTLWPSKYSDFGVQSHLGGRDLVAPYIEACRRHGLKIGLYYSPPDWHFDREYRSFNYGTDSAVRFADRPVFDMQHRTVSARTMPPGHTILRREIFHRRVEELLTRWGRIDQIWFDGAPHDDQILPLVRRLQPHILVNSRVCQGDYEHTECFLPTERPTGWFETPHCWQASDIPAPNGGNVDVWGYLQAEQYKSTAWMLENLVQLRSFGANFLINVGPRPTGEMPEVMYQRLSETAAWMKHSKESVIGTSAGPVDARANAPLTTRGNTWYLHALPGSDGAFELHCATPPSDVRLLRTRQTLPFNWEDGRLSVQIPANMRTALVDVVELSM